MFHTVKWNGKKMLKLYKKEQKGLLFFIDEKIVCEIMKIDIVSMFMNIRKLEMKSVGYNKEMRCMSVYNF